MHALASGQAAVPLRAANSKPHGSPMPFAGSIKKKTNNAEDAEDAKEKMKVKADPPKAAGSAQKPAPSSAPSNGNTPPKSSAPSVSSAQVKSSGQVNAKPV